MACTLYPVSAVYSVRVRVLLCMSFKQNRLFHPSTSSTTSVRVSAFSRKTNSVVTSYVGDRDKDCKWGNVIRSCNEIPI